jgi:hypothetical protein
MAHYIKTLPGELLIDESTFDWEHEDGESEFTDSPALAGVNNPVKSPFWVGTHYKADRVLLGYYDECTTGDLPDICFDFSAEQAEQLAFLLNQAATLLRMGVINWSGVLKDYFTGVELKGQRRK